MKRALAACAAFGLLVFSPAAVAGPAADRASARIRHIAAGDVGAVTAEYAPSATLHWIGGPLDGVYQGAGIGDLWRRFAAANGHLDVSIGPIAEGANPQGATIIAPVVFTGASTIKVRYVLVYRGDMLVEEIWQVDPALEQTW